MARCETDRRSARKLYSICCVKNRVVEWNTDVEDRLGTTARSSGQINPDDCANFNRRARQIVLSDNERLDLAVVSVIQTIREKVHLDGQGGVGPTGRLTGGVPKFEARGPELRLGQRQATAIGADCLSNGLYVSTDMLGGRCRRRRLYTCPDQSIQTSPNVIVWAVVDNGVGPSIRDNGPRSSAIMTDDVRSVKHREVRRSRASKRNFGTGRRVAYRHPG